jgi:hypothetical protein
MDEMTVGICDMGEVLTIEKVVVDKAANDVASVVSEALVIAVTELDDNEDEVLVGMTIVTTVLIREAPVGLAVVKVSVTGDTMLDVPVPVATACVVALVIRGNSREIDVEDE